MMQNISSTSTDFSPNKAQSIKLLWSDKSVKAENDTSHELQGLFPH